MNATVELVLMIASIIIMGMIFYFVYGFRQERGVPYLLGVIGCRIIYASGAVLEKSSETLAATIMFRNIQQTSLIFMVPLLFLFVQRLTGRGPNIRMRGVMLLFGLFALGALMVWLDPFLHVMYRSIELHEGQLVRTRTVYSTLFNMVCYSVVIGALYYLLHYVRNISREFRTPGIWVIVLMSLPLVFEVIKFIRPEWSSWLVPLSVYCSFTGSLMLIITLRHKFFALVPIARNIVIDTLQEKILIVNRAGKVIDSNKPAAEWFSDLGHAAITGRYVSELLADWPQWQRLSRSSEHGNVEINTWLGGQRKIYRINVYPLRPLYQQTQGTISLIFDITEKQQHLEQIAELSQLKDQLITIVSHDIRSPLALQYQLVELLEEDRHRFSTEDQEIIGQLGEQIHQTLGMTSNLLEWFRSQREDMVLRPQLLELHEVVEDCCHILNVRSEAKQISLENKVCAGMHVVADREALGLIIRNLVSNAIKFTGTGGLVEVTAQVSEEMVIISVRDNGVGMDEERVRQLVSERQLNSLAGTRGEKGTGLGLLVSRQFIQRSGGSLWAESKVGQGSVFHFTMRGGTDQ